MWPPDVWLSALRERATAQAKTRPKTSSTSRPTKVDIMSGFVSIRLSRFLTLAVLRSMVLLADFRQVDGWRREFQVEAFEVLDDDPGDGQIAEPFVVGRDDVPGRRIGAAAGEGVVVGSGVIVPEAAFFVV